MAVSAVRWCSQPGFGCMPGISGGILGDFSSGWRLFPKMPGARFGVVECSSGGGDLNGLSENAGKIQSNWLRNQVENWKQTVQRCLDGLPGHWAPALFVLSTWQTAKDPAPPSPALSRRPRALFLLQHYRNRTFSVNTQLHRNDAFDQCISRLRQTSSQSVRRGRRSHGGPAAASQPQWRLAASSEKTYFHSLKLFSHPGHILNVRQ